jgi:hypothetical protein
MGNTLVNMRMDSNMLMRDDNLHKSRSGLPVSWVGYCPICYWLKYLEWKSKQGEDICIQCYAKENK